MKVYELIEFNGTCGMTSTHTTICATREIAEREWRNAVEIAKDDFNDASDKDDITFEECDETLSFSASKEGYGSFEVSIYVNEKKVLEK